MFNWKPFTRSEMIEFLFLVGQMTNDIRKSEKRGTYVQDFILKMDCLTWKMALKSRIMNFLWKL